MYFYAISGSGWQEVRNQIATWRIARAGRRVIAFVGADHGLTDPNVLAQMALDEVDVRSMVRYQGAFHPKVFWLEGQSPKPDMGWQQ